MPIVFWMLPFFIRQILFVEGHGYSHFPTGTDDKPIQGEKLQFNLHDLVLEFLYDYARKQGANLWDFDVMGENKARPERRDRSPVKADMFPLVFGGVETVSTNPLVAYTQLFHNGQPDRNETATINKQIKHHNTYTFTVDRGIDTGLSGTWSAGIPDVVGATSEFSVKFSTLWGNTETTIKETTYSLNLVVNVPPETTVQVLLIISEEVVTGGMRSYVDMAGPKQQPHSSEKGALELACSVRCYSRWAPEGSNPGPNNVTFDGLSKDVGQWNCFRSLSAAVNARKNVPESYPWWEGAYDAFPRPLRHTQQTVNNV
uniref:Putative cytotoxin-like protein n=1 Tax=Ixodes ricinus TaxID=34613 RepID=A0A147BFB6_IXORI